MRKALVVSAVMIGGMAGYGTVDWAGRNLGFAPEKTATEKSGRRDVDLYRHKGDPDWGGDAGFVDRFAVARPVGGDEIASPLLVVLHWRGGGFTSGGINGQIALADEKDRVFRLLTIFMFLCSIRCVITTFFSTAFTTNTAGARRRATAGRCAKTCRE